MGAISVVSKINKIEIPSMPNLKLIKPSIQYFSSTNWKFDVERSKEYQRKRPSKKFVSEEKIATYFEFFSTFFCGPLIIKIKMAPIKGINIIAERIGKFI
jgi:hypothetical protein